MDVTEATEIEKYIHNLQFENEQFIKTIEKEQSIVTALEGQIEEYEGEIVRLQRSTSQLDEDTKLYHRQFIQNRDSIENLKTSVHISQHLETLKERYQHMIQQTQQEKENHVATIEHYSEIWEDYKLKYAEFPQARNLKEASQALHQAQDQLSEAIRHKQQVQEALDKLLTGYGMGFKPFKTTKELIIRLAEVKVSTMKKKADVGNKLKTCQEIERQIQERQREVAIRRQQIQEARRRREEEAERVRIAEQKKREEEMQLAKKRKEEQSLRNAVGQGGHNGPAIATRAEMMSPPPPPSSAAHRYTGDTHLPTQRSSFVTSTASATLQMPPIISQSPKSKVPLLQMPARPSAFMPQLCIPAMSPCNQRSYGPGPAVPPSAMSAPLTIPSPARPAPDTQTPTMLASTMPSPAVPAPTQPTRTVLAHTMSAPNVPQSTTPAPIIPASTPQAVPPLTPAFTMSMSPSPPKGKSTPTPRSEYTSPTVPLAAQSVVMKDYVPKTACTDVNMAPVSMVIQASSVESTTSPVESSTKSVSPPPVKTPRRGVDNQGFVVNTPEAMEEGGSMPKTPKTPKTPTTPGTTGGGQKTPKTPGDFNLERQLAKLKLLTADSPMFHYGARPMFEQEEDTTPKEGGLNLPFFQTFRPQGGGDELQKPSEAETSAKGVGSSPIPEAEKTPAGLMGAGDAAASPAYNQNFFFTEPADPSTHAGSGMNMFGSAKNQDAELDDGGNFNFLTSSSGSGGMSLFGDAPMGQREAPKSSNMFSMFGGDSNQGDEEEDTGFSFNFGGASSDQSGSSATTPFSLF